MSAIIKNITVPSVTSPVVLGINTTRKASTGSMYKNYSTTAPKKWVRQSTAKRFTMDWDMNQNELEFE